MAKYSVTDTSLASVADAIRAKGGTSDAMAFPTGFVSAIEAITAGGGALKTATGKWNPSANTNSYTVTGLSFKPKVIIACYQVTSTNNSTPGIYGFCAEGITGHGRRAGMYFSFALSNATDSSGTIEGTLLGGTGQFFITSYSYTWYAFG